MGVVSEDPAIVPPTFTLPPTPTPPVTMRAPVPVVVEAVAFVMEIAVPVVAPLPVTDDNVEVLLMVTLVVPENEMSVPAVNNAAIFWNVGDPPPAEVKIWFALPTAVWATTPAPFVNSKPPLLENALKVVVLEEDSVVNEPAAGAALPIIVPSIWPPVITAPLD